MSLGRVLVVDDEVQIRRAVARSLKARDYDVREAPDGQEAMALLATFAPDLVVLDLNLPGMDGLEVCRRMRSAGSVPILILSVREDETDKVAALDLGADDYLTKPFGTGELLARVRALLRRAPLAPGSAPRRFAAPGLEINIDSHTIVKDAQSIRLTRTEWLLLEELSSRPGKLLTHRWLLEKVWGLGYAEDVDVLRVFVSQLRKKIERDARSPEIILTDPGIGYRWSLAPSADPAGAQG